MPLHYIWRTAYHKPLPEPIAFNRREFLLQDYYATANTSPFVNSFVINTHRGHPYFWRFSRRAETHSKLEIGILWHTGNRQKRACVLGSCGQGGMCVCICVCAYVCVCMVVHRHKMRREPPTAISKISVRNE